MLLLFALFFFQSPDWINLVQSLGFPIVVAGALMYFAYKVWQYTVKKIDEKDVLIAAMIAKEEAEHEKLIETQEKIIETQNQIVDVMRQLQQNTNKNRLRSA